MTSSQNPLLEPQIDPDFTTRPAQTSHPMSQRNASTRTQRENDQITVGETRLESQCAARDRVLL